MRFNVNANVITYLHLTISLLVLIYWLSRPLQYILIQHSSTHFPRVFNMSPYSCDMVEQVHGICKSYRKMEPGVQQTRFCDTRYTTLQPFSLLISHLAPIRLSSYLLQRVWIRQEILFT